MAALFIVGLGVAEFQSSGGTIVVVLYLLPFAGAMVLVAAWRWLAAVAASQAQLERAGIFV